MKYITLENGRPDMNLVDKECPIELKMLMMRCWDKFPSNRPNFNEILTCLDYLAKWYTLLIPQKYLIIINNLFSS